MDKIQEFIFKHRLNPYTMPLLSHKDALAFLSLLRGNRLQLYGFDGFHLLKNISPKAIQIDQAYSIDYSDDSFESAYQKAMDFFEKHPEQDIGYEFVYEKRA